jgi:hypothetical protein
VYVLIFVVRYNFSEADYEDQHVHLGFPSQCGIGESAEKYIPGRSDFANGLVVQDGRSLKESWKALKQSWQKLRDTFREYRDAGKEDPDTGSCTAEHQGC